jgi:hypothetical protein
MRVIKTFFLSAPLKLLGLVKPADVGPFTVSDVKDCASLLLRILDRPKEPFPSATYEPDVNAALDSDGRIWTLVPVPLYARTSELPNMQFENVFTSSLYSRADL